MKSYDDLKTRIEQCGVHAQLGPVGEGWGIEQNPHELATFLVRMQELDVQSVLEIGTGYKAGLARFLAHEMDWEVTTVDVQDYGHLFENITYIYLDENGNWVWLWGDGHARRSIGNVQKYMRFDLVFIDGNHAYDSVKHDYETYAQCATKAIAFHDIAGLRECEGAQKFWHQLMFTEGWKHADVVVTPNVQGAGIGWIEL